MLSASISHVNTTAQRAPFGHVTVFLIILCFPYCYGRLKTSMHRDRIELNALSRKRQIFHGEQW